MQSVTLIKTAAAAVWALSCVSLHAQTIPDAGRLLQEQTQPPKLPKSGQGVSIPSPALQSTPSGGAQVVLQSIRFNGNTRFTEQELQEVLTASLGKSFDLAGLRELTNRVTEHYHAAGYAFASAYLPPQPMQDGALQIAIVEGKYGQIKAQSSDAQLATVAQALLAPLQSGSVIESSELARLSLILDDLPGIKATPILRPGQAVGTGDLDVKIERSERFAGDIGIDNQGNRYTGQNRLRANLDINSPFVLGDQITVRSLSSELGMRMATLGYSLPLAGSGLRATTSYGHTYYELGGGFSSSQSSGTADVLSLGLSYPLHRSQQVNLTVSGSLQNKKLNDQRGADASSTDKNSTTLPLALNFDRRDGRGVTYGTVSWTSGQLGLDSALRTADAQAHTEGSFNKFNVDVARMQSLNWGQSGDFSLYARLSAQHANKNLDSSEDFGLGGVTGVRAYPSGEAYGDSGWLTQFELRHTIGAYAPYVFYDAGSIKTNANPWSTGVNDRTIAGAGFGLRYQRAGWSLDAALAWRTVGGLPQSDTQDLREQGPQIWLSLGWRF